MHNLMNAFEENEELKGESKRVQLLYFVNLLFVTGIWFGLNLFYAYYTEPKLAEAMKPQIVYDCSSLVVEGEPMVVSSTIVYGQQDVLARGACVDKAQTILSILKRRYVAYDRIKVALSPNHVQIIRQDIDGSIEYLDINDFDVYVGSSDFANAGSSIVKIISPEIFLEAIDFYKPEISIEDINRFVAVDNG